MRNRIVHESRLAARSLGACLMATILAACAGPATHRVSLHYVPMERGRITGTVTVGITPFQDHRQSPQLLGFRYRPDGKRERIILRSPNPAADLTQILRELLLSRGVRVRALPPWKPEPGALKDLPADIQVAVSGRIDTMKVEARSSPFRTTVSYKIRITAHLGLTDRGELLTRSVEITPQTSSWKFDPWAVQRSLNEDLIEILDQLLEGVVPPRPRAS